MAQLSDATNLDEINGAEGERGLEGHEPRKDDGNILARIDRMTRTHATIEVPELAPALRMSVWNTHRRIRNGELGIEPLRIGSRILFRSSDVRALLGLDAA